MYTAIKLHWRNSGVILHTFCLKDLPD